MYIDIHTYIIYVIHLDVFVHLYDMLNRQTSPDRLKCECDNVNSHKSNTPTCKKYYADGIRFRVFCISFLATTIEFTRKKNNDRLKS